MQQYVFHIILGVLLLVVLGNSTILRDDLKKNTSEDFREFLDFTKLLSRQATNFTTAQRNFQRQVLHAHNTYRLRHCVRSLRLDDRLSRSAQNYAQRLANMNTMVHSGIKGLGENLYTMSSSNKITNVDGEEIHL